MLRLICKSANFLNESLVNFHRLGGCRNVSKSSPKSPDLLSLDVAKEPDYQAHDFIYGVHPVSCAVAAKRRTIHTVFYKRDLAETNRIKTVLQQCWAENIQTKPIVWSKLKGPKDQPKHNLFAKVSRLYYAPARVTREGLEELSRDRVPDGKQLWLLLHAIQDPMNFGSILRTAYWLGVRKIFVTRHESCALSPTVSQASSGVMELIPIHSVANSIDFATKLQEMGWNVIATQSSTQAEVPSVPITRLKLEKPSLLIFGNEGSGLPEDLVSSCTQSVFIRANSLADSKVVDSLNVSAAAAIILHALLSPE